MLDGAIECKPIQLGPWPHKQWEPILGCSMADHSCRNCYAAARLRLLNPNHPGIRCDGPRTFFTGKLTHNPALWDAPLHDQNPAVVFAFSQSDLFHPGVRHALRCRAFDTMSRAAWMQFNLLTKRPENLAMFLAAWAPEHGYPPANIRIGISVATQKYMDLRWPIIRDCAVGPRIISAQPLLEPLTLPPDATGDNVGWVVAMREIGPGARPASPTWFRRLRDLCRARRIPFFWETTPMDSPECVAERRRAALCGDAYETQPEGSHIRPIA